MRPQFITHLFHIIDESPPAGGTKRDLARHIIGFYIGKEKLRDQLERDEYAEFQQNTISR